LIISKQINSYYVSVFKLAMAAIIIGTVIGKINKGTVN